MTRVVFFSSGIGSYVAAKRIAQELGTADLVLLFSDTGIEDPDNYRFLEEAAADIGGRLVKLKSEIGNVFDSWEKRRAIASNRWPFCSEDLKRAPARAWLKENDPENKATLVVGIGWDEVHRLPPIQKGWAPRRVEAPLTNAPYWDKPQMLDFARSQGIKPPRMYGLGFPHANCGGGCVRAGFTQWRHLLRVLPEVYARWEQAEQSMRCRLGRQDIAILTRQVRGRAVPVTLRQLREEQEMQMDLLDPDDWGGCGCFASDRGEEVAA